MCYYKYYAMDIAVTGLWTIIKLVSLLKCIHLVIEYMVVIYNICEARSQM